MIDRSFWSGKRVFLTGHTGFKGGWAAVWLHDMGALVTGFALPAATTPSFFSVADVEPLVAHHLGDVRDFNALSAALWASKPDIVLHMAAQPLVRRSYAQPLETYATNVMGTAHVLEAVRQCPGIRATIIVTSDKCYDNDESGRPLHEDDPMGGHDPYSSSKGAAELITAAYLRSYFPARNVASVRAGNVIGGGDWSEDRLVPDIVGALRANRPVALRHPRAVRPWQHVMEPLAGYFILAQRLAKGTAAGGGWNFGPDPAEIKPVSELARAAISIWDGAGTLSIAAPSSEHEAGILLLDSTKARTTLGWRPRWSFDDAIGRTMAWYRAHAEGAMMQDVTLAQIRAYERT